MRRIRYQEIAEALRARVRSAAPGSLLPSESELSREFAASRVTVRRALELVRDEGLIASRQGLGWFVAADLVPQRLERLDTIEAQLEQQGRTARREVIDFSFEHAPEHVGAILATDRVLRVKRLNLADGDPFAIVTVWCPAKLAHHLSMSDVQQKPFSELLDVQFSGATQTIGADVASADVAELLGVPVGAPLLKCRRVTADVSGVSVLLSEFVFPAHRTEFVIDMAQEAPSMVPTGLRLVE